MTKSIHEPDSSIYAMAVSRRVQSHREMLFLLSSVIVAFVLLQPMSMLVPSDWSGVVYPAAKSDTSAITTLTTNTNSATTRDASPISINVPAYAAKTQDGNKIYTTEVRALDQNFLTEHDNDSGNGHVDWVFIYFPHLTLSSKIEVQEVYFRMFHYEDVRSNKVGPQHIDPVDGLNTSTDVNDDFYMWNGTDYNYLGDYPHKTSETEYTSDHTQTTVAIQTAKDPAAALNDMKLLIFIGNDKGNNAIHIDYVEMVITYIPYDPPETKTPLSVNPDEISVFGNYSVRISESFTDLNNNKDDFAVTVAIRGPSPVDDVHYLCWNAHNGQQGVNIVMSSPGTFDFWMDFNPPDNTSDGFYDFYLMILDGEGGRLIEDFPAHDDILRLRRAGLPEVTNVSASMYSVNRVGPRDVKITVSISDNDSYSSDFVVSLYLRAGISGKVYMLADNLSTSNGLNIEGTSEYFNATFIWDPPDDADVDYYSARVLLSDGITEVESSYNDNKDIIYVYDMANRAPSAPTNLRPASTTSLRPTITWDPSMDEDNDPLSYEVRIGTASGQGDFINWTSTGNQTSYTPTKNMDYGTYYVDVRAFDGMNYSEMLPGELVVFKDNTPPEAPAGLQPTETYENTPTLSWDASFDPDGDPVVYNISIGTSPGGSDITNGVEVTNTYYTVPTELQPGTYYVSITAFDGYAYSEVYNASFTVIKQNNAPSAPISIIPVETSDTTPNITWTPSTDPDGDMLRYFIKIGRNEHDASILPWTLVDEPYYQVPDDRAFERGTYVTVVVRAWDGRLNSTDRVQSITVTSDANTPPRPVSSSGTIQLHSKRQTIYWPEFTDVDGDSVGYTMDIYTSNGILLDSQTVSVNHTEPDHDIPPGNYYAIITAFDGFDTTTLNISITANPIDYFTALLTLTPGVYSLDLTRSSTGDVEFNVTNNDVIDSEFVVYIYTPDNVTATVVNVSGSVVRVGTVIHLNPGEERAFIVKVTRNKTGYEMTEDSLRIVLAFENGTIIKQQAISISLPKQQSSLTPASSGSYWGILVVIVVILLVLGVVAFLLKDKIAIIRTKHKVKTGILEDQAHDNALDAETVDEDELRHSQSGPVTIDIEVKDAEDNFQPTTPEPEPAPAEPEVEVAEVEVFSAPPQPAAPTYDGEVIEDVEVVEPADGIDGPDK